MDCWEARKKRKMRTAQRERAKEALITHGFDEAVDLLRTVYGWTQLDALYTMVKIREEIEMEKAHGKTFDHWMKLVNEEVERIAFCSVSDLADWTVPFIDAFEDGVSPKEAAIATLKENGFPVDLL